MNLSTPKHLGAFALALLLSNAAHAEFWTTDELVKGFNEVSAQIDRGELTGAESSLAAMRGRTEANDVRIEQYQRELAGAYLRQGQQQLSAGNASAAAASLAKAKPYIAKAPSLKAQYEKSLAATTTASAPVPAAKPLAIAAPLAKPAPTAEEIAARRAEAERREREAAALAEKKAAQKKAADEKAAQAERDAEAKRLADATPRAQLIDPNAASSEIAMPMLDAQDRESLRTLLDAVAADVVAFNCAVRVEVRESKDYPFVAALLSARIKKLNPGLVPQLSPSLKPDQVPRLVLSPQAKG